jgi:excisionase family DNA binding protein
MEAVLEKPTLHEQRVARESLFGFAAALAERTSDSINIRLQESQQSFTIPTKALELLTFILSSMAEGKAISLVPSDAELTTQQAADMLNVSRPHVVKLLEQGTIPFKKVGSHRRILLDDLLTYDAQHKANRKANLRFLAEQAQDLNLGYE